MSVGASTIGGMKIMATIRNVETREVGTVVVEAGDYDTGYRMLEAKVLEGWQMLNVGVER